MEIYIVRHGLSEANEKKILQGRIDFPLADEGRRQSHHLGKYFTERQIAFDRAVASNLSRAKETAEIILGYQGNPPLIEEEEGFQEVDIGDLQGLNGEEVTEKFPQYYGRGPERWMDFSEFGGETWTALCSRVNEAMPRYVNKDNLLDDTRLLIVAHGGVIRAMMSQLLCTSANFMFLRVENCCHIKINYMAIRGHTRRYIEYILPLDEMLVGGKPFEHGISGEERDKLVS